MGSAASQQYPLRVDLEAVSHLAAGSEIWKAQDVRRASNACLSAGGDLCWLRRQQHAHDGCFERLVVVPQRRGKRPQARRQRPQRRLTRFLALCAQQESRSC